MARIPLAIVGCGGMGHRHLYGLAELHRSGLSPFELVGACDPVTDNAESLATNAEQLLGKRPVVVKSLEELVPLGVAAVDITTTPRYHHTLGVEAIERNWHAMIEKPVGLTVRACNRIQKAAAASSRVVSVAENYRRDPINRLAKALIDNGAIGDPRFMIHQTAGGGNQMTISVWRHQKDQSGVLLDVGVHFADIMEYFLGEIDSVYAQMRLFEPIRYNPAALGKESTSNPAGVYAKAQRQMPAEFKATADDAVFAVVNFRNGAVGQYLENHAGHGQGIWNRQIHGSKGSMDMPNDRTGKVLKLTLDRTKVIDDASILDLAPDFHLDEATSTLFGGDRLWKYDFPFELIDRKLIAVEYADFGLGIEGKRPVEVDLAQGSRSVAVSYAMMESGYAGGKLLKVDDVLAEKVTAYQQDVDEGMGDRMKLGYSTWGMPKLSIDLAVDRIASLGYDGLEISVLPAWTTSIDTLDAAERKRILKLVNSKGLTISAISGHASLLEEDPAENERNLQRLKAAIDLAVQWEQNGRIPYVNTLSGGHTADWDAQKELFAERLLPAAAYAKSRGVTLAMEPHIDGLVDTPERMVTILKLVNEPALKVNFDISHFDIIGMPTEESVAILAPYTVHTHVKDQRGRYPNYEFLTPGEGDFDYVEYLKAMAAHGYDGFINAEIGMMRQRKTDYDALAACDLSYATLSKAFANAGIARR